MQPKPLYLVILDDRHQDVLYWAFTSPEKAIAFAHEKVDEYLTGNRELRDLTEGSNRGREHILLHLEYSCEGDSIEVQEVEVS